ncbi:MAG: hypothetical protein CL535_10290 [Ahrensia sp.]|nr:hypothetical protein [Ahrensia sp.]|tara:strand:+ start:62699 stop:63676 length:978 start_codon:yes stop_codon:yes gene_type:complete
MNNKLTLVAIATSAALFAAGSAQAKTFRLACPSAETSTTCKTASRFAELVGKNAEDIEIQVFPGGQIGSGESAIQQMRAGVIDLVVEDISNYGNFLTDYNVVSWGFTFRDEQHFQDFLVSDLEAGMEEQLKDDQGIKIIAANWRKLPRVVVSTTPVKTPEDLEGLKFRVPGIPSYIATWKTLGTNPTQVPWSDSFQALKTGVVDAMEAPLDSVLSQKFHVAAPNVSLTNHVFASISIAMNGKQWDALSEEQQRIMTDAAQQAADYSAELASEASSTIRSQLEADGATVIDVDRSAFAAKLKDAAHKQEVEGLWSEGLYDKIQAID